MNQTLIWSASETSKTGDLTAEESQPWQYLPELIYGDLDDSACPEDPTIEDPDRSFSEREK